MFFTSIFTEKLEMLNQCIKQKKETGKVSHRVNVLMSLEGGCGG
jgi:hypothetical protein